MDKIEEEEQLVIVGIAALFRAASIAKGEEDNNRWENTHAIKEATEFVNACKAHGLLPEKFSKP